jgi:hypothetical protein
MIFIVSHVLKMEDKIKYIHTSRLPKKPTTSIELMDNWSYIGE